VTRRISHDHRVHPVDSGKLRAPGAEFEFDEAQLAAVSFLARYRSSTAAVPIAMRTRDANAPTALGLRWPQDDPDGEISPASFAAVDDLDRIDAERPRTLMKTAGMASAA
jgi:hypothetical protein